MKLTIELDELDAIDWNKAVAVRQRHRINGECILPDSETDLARTILGEICRDWLEQRGEWTWAKP